MDTVSDFATCCAHCGWIEPENFDEVMENDSGCIYVHDESCRAMENDGVEHELFMALWNARTHMKMNDVLLRRAKENIEEAMIPYINNQLTPESWFCIRESDKFWLKD